jgi:ATP-dependent DNA helicase UvrD/PcrA
MLVSSAPPLPTLLEDLTPAQRRAVETRSATVCVLAAAGAGKTRVLTRRIAYRALSGTAKPGHVLAITFTKKAAVELRERLAGLGLDSCSHVAAVGPPAGVQVPVAGPWRPPAMPPGGHSGGALFAGTFHSFAWRQLRRWWADRRTPQPVVLQSKVRLVGELVPGRAGLAEVPVADLAGCIEWAKARLVTPAAFAGAAKAANRELPADAEAVAALYARYEDEKRRRRLVDFDDLLARYTEALSSDTQFGAAQRWKWAHVFVDELQDVNPLQCRLLVALLGGNDDLFVVGDPNQAIYGWNGADPGFLTSFPSRFPDAEVVRLDDNHRSSPQVVAAATAVLGRQSAGALRSTRPGGPLPAMRCFASEHAEATGIAAEALGARAHGQKWREMAVLARTNSQLTVIAEALSAASIPFSVSLPEKAACPPAPAPASSAGAENHTGEPADPDGTVTVCTFHRAKGLQWPAVWVAGLESGLVPIAYATSPASLAEERRLLYVAFTRAETALHCSWARERRAANGASVRRAPSPWLAAIAPFCSGTGQGGDEDDVMLGPGDLGTRRGAGQGAAPFLAMARGRLARAPAAWEGRHRPRGPASQTGAAGPPNAAVAEQLREWRRRHARASGVPPHVLLHDSTLLALARVLPSTDEELLGVPGLGPVKVARFGGAILDIVSAATSGRAVGDLAR